MDSIEIVMAAAVLSNGNRLVIDHKHLVGVNPDDLVLVIQDTGDQIIISTEPKAESDE